MLPPLTVFDVETTGLDPRKGSRIIEIAGMRIEHGIIQEESAFTSFVNPECSLPPETRQISKLTDEDVREAPTIMNVLPDFLAFAKGSILVAHNAAFDRGFLEVEKDHCWGYIELPETFCTMKLSQSLFPQEFRHNLDTLAKRFELRLPENRHRALPDVLLTAKALLRMLEIGKITHVDELRKRASLEYATA
ncbi:DNA polymerase III subunit epsilon [Candidatus Peregrinibacteria bacterium CG10_big_fil_rev_8_21_14_0_10_49_16]|nr:MAG: DNA polymerase III subunit epsilon [Candidatus Peregrinibacteria bacterium CG22_combo_CG10-13_8_21_14_all_49_11]PIR52075.1 MAG: DNA polymerase III subunit epsilon [Candidatus Peregrinibacteria bacterium CG10_big_fil_rev_8_21_14_0_10_49_16]